jgi:hypothetical protein
MYMSQKQSSKMFAIEITTNRRTKGLESRVRTLVSSEERYDPDKHFLAIEESDYLNDVLGGVPYATYKTDSQETFEHFLTFGYKDAAGVVWRQFFAYWKEQEGRAFMAPEDAGITDQRKVGVITDKKTASESLKIGKYVNRLFTNYPKPEYGGTGPIWGHEIDWIDDEQTALVQVEPHGDLTLEDCELSIRYVDLKMLDAEQKALVDGCIAVSEKAVIALHLSNEPKLGLAWRVTIATQRGFGKGHMVYVPHLKHDIVIYGPKTVVKTDRFFFGNMGRLHVSKPKTDFQSFVNFRFDRDNMALDLAREYMKTVIASSQDEARLRSLLLTHVGDGPDVEHGEDAWVLRHALRHGISFRAFPGLFRRVIRYLAGQGSPVFQCDEKARIPMDTIADYGYVLPDIRVIDSEGDIQPQFGIPSGTIVCPDMIPGTKIIAYRQPSEHSNAWVELTVVDVPELHDFVGKGVCMLGREAQKVLSVLGGGDMDDMFVLVYDPKWVAAFHTLPKYPTTEKLVAETAESEIPANDEFFAGLPMAEHSATYSIRDVHNQIEMAKNARAGIGPVVNFGMIDMLLSDPDQKAAMLSDLSADPANSLWLEERTPWQAANYMTNLEIVIDGNVKDSTLLRKLGDVSGTISRFHKNCRVYPVSMANRIPFRRSQLEDYVLARSLTCRALEDIRKMRDRMLNILIDFEWKVARPADKVLQRLGYPYEKEIHVFVAGDWKYIDRRYTRMSDAPFLEETWAKLWKEEMAYQRDHTEAYQRICNELADKLRNLDDEMMEKIAVHIYYNKYRKYEAGAKVDVNNNLRHYNDGLLWSPVFNRHFIRALIKAGVTGYYKAVDFVPQLKRRFKDIDISVQVRTHSIYVGGDEGEYSRLIGFVWGYSPDGTYRMNSGIIEFIQPQPICLPTNV